MTSSDYEMLDLVDDLEGRRLAVVGDVMLDVWLEGPVKRVSPEAPVPVVELASTRQRLGGAANVAAVIGALGGSASVLGLVGDDGGSQLLSELLEEAGGTPLLVEDPSRPTTRKTRVVSGPQQLCRIDEESPGPADGEVADRLRALVQAALDGAEAVVLSDYGKGVLDDGLIALVCGAAAEQGLPVVADPWGAGAARFGAATVVKPNRLEACAALGAARDSSVADLAADLRARIGGGAVLVTDGAAGMALADRAGVYRIPAIRREVADVTGAGDAVAAVLAAALGGGAGLRAAAEMGNAAGAVAVTKRGTAPFGPGELQAVVAGPPAGDG